MTILDLVGFPWTLRDPRAANPCYALALRLFTHSPCHRVTTPPGTRSPFAMSPSHKNKLDLAGFAWMTQFFHFLCSIFHWFAWIWPDLPGRAELRACSSRSPRPSKTLGLAGFGWIWLDLLGFAWSRRVPRLSSSPATTLKKRLDWLDLVECKTRQRPLNRRGALTAWRPETQFTWTRRSCAPVLPDRPDPQKTHGLGGFGWIHPDFT